MIYVNTPRRRTPTNHNPYGAVNSASYVLHHSSGRLTSVGRHPAGNVTGLTLIDYLALPPRARVAITYNGDEVRAGGGRDMQAVTTQCRPQCVESDCVFNFQAVGFQIPNCAHTTRAARGSYLSRSCDTALAGGEEPDGVYLVHYECCGANTHREMDGCARMEREKENEERARGERGELYLDSHAADG